MGPDPSQVQAVFTPEGDSPRWISQPLTSNPANPATPILLPPLIRGRKPPSRASWPHRGNRAKELGYTIRMRKQGNGGTKIVVDTEDKTSMAFSPAGSMTRRG